MHQFQVIVETDGHRLLESQWVTGRESATKLTALIASKFPEPTYLVTVAHQTVDLVSPQWDAFLMEAPV